MVTAVPIVPMIDILTILLIFFIIHTQWKNQQYVLKIDAPSTEYIQGEKTEKLRDVLAVSSDGQVSFRGKLVSIEALPFILRKYKSENPEGKLQQDIDKGVSIEMLVKVIDALTGAGIDVPEVPIRINPISAPKGEN